MTTKLFYRGPSLAEQKTDYAKNHRVDHNAPFVSASIIGVSARIEHVVPAGERRSALLDKIGVALRSAGGSFEVHQIAAFAGSDEAELIKRFNAARDAEYAEIVENAERTVAELRRERAAGKLSFAEVEENEADMTRLSKWLRRVGERDVFGAPGRTAAAIAVNQAEETLSEYTKEVLAIEDR